MGVTLFATSFVSGMSAGCADNRQLLLVFAVMAFIAAILILLPKRKKWNIRMRQGCRSVHQFFH